MTEEIFPSQGAVQLEGVPAGSGVPMCLLPLSFLIVEVVGLGDPLRVDKVSNCSTLVYAANTVC